MCFPLFRQWPRAAAAVWVVLACAVAARAQFDQYAAPASYYSTITNQSGTALHNALHAIISNNAQVSYDNARYALQVLDEDINNPDRLILFYDHTSLDLSVINPAGTNSGSNIKGWDAGKSWQREHTWPQSRGADESTPAGHDLHMLRPAGSSNQSRSNLNYGGTGTTAGRSGSYWYPGNADRGEAARGAFYADVRYDGGDGSSVDLKLVNGNPASGTGQMGDLNAMLHWHYADPVDPATELRRNDLIYRTTNWSTSSRYADISNRTFVQGNRNPFVDRPEYVWARFVDNANATRLSLAGATVDGNGASATTVNLGRVLRNAAVPTAQNVTINKDGVDGTYYSVTTAGAATSSVSGRYNAFTMDTTGTRTMAVGLNTTTATAGVKTGTVTVDNLDITTAGGAGRGANDGNDVVTVNLSVLAASNSSFASADTNALTLDFGSVHAGTTPAQKAFSVYNLADSTLGSSLTARMDLKSFSGTGDTGRFNLDLAIFTDLLAGDSKIFDTVMNTAQVGVFHATYTLQLSDEFLPGTVSTSTLQLTLQGSVTANPEPAVLAPVMTLLLLLRRRRPATSQHRQAADREQAE